jgi:hypothetical protein
MARAQVLPAGGGIDSALLSAESHASKAVDLLRVCSRSRSGDYDEKRPGRFFAVGPFLSITSPQARVRASADRRLAFFRARFSLGPLRGTPDCPRSRERHHRFAGVRGSRRGALGLTLTHREMYLLRATAAAPKATRRHGHCRGLLRSPVSLRRATCCAEWFEILGVAATELLVSIPDFRPDRQSIYAQGNPYIEKPSPHRACVTGLTNSRARIEDCGNNAACLPILTSD